MVFQQSGMQAGMMQSCMLDESQYAGAEEQHGDHLCLSLVQSAARLQSGLENLQQAPGLHKLGQIGLVGAAGTQQLQQDA